MAAAYPPERHNRGEKDEHNSTIEAGPNRSSSPLRDRSLLGERVPVHSRRRCRRGLCNYVRHAKFSYVQCPYPYLAIEVRAEAFETDGDVPTSWGGGTIMKALITGGTGLIGSELLANLQDSVVLSRDAARARGKRGVSRAFAWDSLSERAPLEALQEIDVVFNLAGEPVAEGRWTEDKKRRIRDSRVIGTRNLVAGLRALDRKPEVLVSASAVGYYGDRGDEVLDETSPAGRDFLAEVCTEWEREAFAAEALGVRVVCVRIGVVLAQGGGALTRMLTPFKMGVGGRLGSGNQWMPWIHIDDVVGVLLHAARTSAVSGAMNAVSPHPVTNTEFTKALGRAVERPTFLSVPKTVLRIAFGEVSSVLMASQRVLPRAAERTGYAFQHTHLDHALAAVMAASGRKAA
jgi:uncharacterized protein